MISRARKWTNRGLSCLQPCDLYMWHMRASQKRNWSTLFSVNFLNSTCTINVQFKNEEKQNKKRKEKKVLPQVRGQTWKIAFGKFQIQVTSSFSFAFQFTELIDTWPLNVSRNSRTNIRLIIISRSWNDFFAGELRGEPVQRSESLLDGWETPCSRLRNRGRYTGE